jgi:hypothetical protein
MNTQALNEKLLKFARLKFKTHFIRFGGVSTPYSGYYLNNKFVRRTKPDLVHNLNYQYKYLWPKLRKLGFMIRYQYSQLRDNDTAKLISGWTYYCEIYDISYKRGLNNFQYWAINRDNPALACALAIEKLIDNMEKEVCPLCGKYSPNNEVHKECSDKEAFEASK